MNKKLPICSFIISKSGGLDGVALQAREYRYMLNSMNFRICLITGSSENQFSLSDPIGQEEIIIPRLSLYHKSTQMLYHNQFTDYDGNDKISESEWIKLFVFHKNSIKTALKKILLNTDENTLIFVFNFLSLRHSHIAASSVIKDLIIENPKKIFISHSADPDAERPEIIGRIKKFVLPLISCNKHNEEYSGGPLNYKNLYHIVLNPIQRNNFFNKYDIESSHIFEIPDFLDFKSKEPIIKKYPNPVFMDYLSDCRLIPTKKSYKYIRESINEDMIFFLSPVRPVYRKRLIESMFVVQQYGKYINQKVAFVVTHPNIDDMNYFIRSLNFAYDIGLPYYHLGEHFSLSTLEDVYENFSALKTIGVIASSAGGWENALNEMARACIPFYMNRNLNSYKPLTEKIGIITHGVDFSIFTDIINNTLTKKIKDNVFSSIPEMNDLFFWINKVLDTGKRTEIITQNYKRVYDYLSHDTIKSKFEEAINLIFKKGCKLNE